MIKEETVDDWLDGGTKSEKPVLIVMFLVS